MAAWAGDRGALEEIRLSDSTNEWTRWSDPPAAHGNYQRAFRALGIDIDAMTIEESARLIRAQAIHEQLSSALDGWSKLRRFLVVDKSELARDKPDDWSQRPLAVARRVDTDEFRNRVRVAVERADQAAPYSNPRSRQMPHAYPLPRWTYWSTNSSQPTSAISALKMELLKRAQSARPDDFYINYSLAMGRPDPGGGESMTVVDGKVLRRATRGNDLLLGDEAIIYAMAAVALRPSNAYGRGALAAALHRSGRFDDALAAYREALHLDPDSFPAYGNIGIILYQQGKLDEALAIYRKLIQREPDNANVHAILGSVLSGQGKLDEAVVAYRKAIELVPEDAEFHNSLGIVLENQGKLAEAIAAYRKAIELDPKDAAVYCNLGDALRKLGKLDESVVACRKAVELQPNLAPAHLNLGNDLSELGKLDEAIAELRRAIELDPDTALAYNNLGNALKDMGQLDEAIAAYRKVLELKPDCVAGYSNLANALSKQGHFDEALAANQKVIELEPKNPAGYNGVAWLLATAPTPEVRDPARAVELATRAVELASADGGSWNTLGLARYTPASGRPPSRR